MSETIHIVDSKRGAALQTSESQQHIVTGIELRVSDLQPAELQIKGFGTPLTTVCT